MDVGETRPDDPRLIEHVLSDPMKLCEIVFCSFSRINLIILFLTYIRSLTTIVSIQDQLFFLLFPRFISLIVCVFLKCSYSLKFQLAKCYGIQQTRKTNSKHYQKPKHNPTYLTDANPNSTDRSAHRIVISVNARYGPNKADLILVSALRQANPSLLVTDI